MSIDVSLRERDGRHPGRPRGRPVGLPGLWARTAAELLRRWRVTATLPVYPTLTLRWPLPPPAGRPRRTGS
jgi:hypothetical protein